MEKFGVWFPTIKTGTGTDSFTLTLKNELESRGIRAEITWLPHRAEYAPWTVPTPRPPQWASITHVNSWTPARLLPNQLPVVATVHHSIHSPEFEAAKSRLQSLYHKVWVLRNEQRTLTRASRVTAVSHYVASATKRDIADIELEVIYNGIDLKTFTPKVSSPHTKFRVLFIGSWISRKGIDLLPPIMAALGEDFELIYTGDSPGRSSRNMRDIGKLDGKREVAHAMQDADVLLLPTRSEGFGLVIAEAMACKLPVVTSRIPPAEELIEKGQTGFLCPVDDVNAFASAIRNLRDSGDLRKQITESAYERVSRLFSVDTMVDGYVSLYRSILESRS